jgi:hypothetical protein
MLSYRRLRPGQWVLYRGQIGIINQISDDRQLADFHAVDDQGYTVGSLPVPLRDLDMPTRAHIPAPRLVDIHPDWQPGMDVRYTDEYLARHGDTARQHATATPDRAPGPLTGVSSLEFVEPEDFQTFTPAARASVSHVRDPETGDRHE